MQLNLTIQSILQIQYLSKNKLQLFCLFLQSVSVLIFLFSFHFLTKLRLFIITEYSIFLCISPRPSSLTTLLVTIFKATVKLSNVKQL